MADCRSRLIIALREHLAGGRLVVPEGCELIWKCFLELSRTRSYGLTPNPITYAEMEAFCRLLRMPLEPDHIKTIRALDNEWLERARGGAADGNIGRYHSSQELTPDAFDAVF